MASPDLSRLLACFYNRPHARIIKIMGGIKGIYIGPGRGGHSRGLARLISALTALLIGSAVIGLFIAALVVGSILAALLLIVVVVALVVFWIKYLFRARRSRY